MHAHSTVDGVNVLYGTALIPFVEMDSMLSNTLKEDKPIGDKVSTPIETETNAAIRPSAHEGAIDILRGLTFLLVLFGHSFPDSAYEYISPLTKFLHDYIYSFHMPLFFFISGFCMLHVLARQELNVFSEIEKRAERLLVPYFFWSYVAIVPKILFASLMYLPFDKTQLWTTLLGQSPNGTLWYLWTLFFVNLLYLLVSRMTRDWRS